MIKISNTEVFGLDRAINAISNSYSVGEINTTVKPTEGQENVALVLGKNTECCQSHDAYLRGITVYFDIKYPQYWTPEFQRYHFAEIIMSQSTMHSLKRMLSDDYDPYNKYVSKETKEMILKLVANYEKDPSYENFIVLRSNLPAGFELSETVVTNYKQLKTIWIQRHNHKLKEDWGAFCNWIESLPKFKELCIGKFIEEENEKKIKNTKIHLEGDFNSEFSRVADILSKKYKIINSDRKVLRFNASYLDGYGTKIAEFNGGFNGSGNWGKYFVIFSELVKLLRTQDNNIKNVWLVELTPDTLDDVFTLKLGFDISE